jgi:hypothetical protein
MTKQINTVKEMIKGRAQAPKAGKVKLWVLKERLL